MKQVIILVTVVGLIAISWRYYAQEEVIEYIQGETQVVEKTVEVETLQKRVDEAITASSTEIEIEAQKAYTEAKEQIQKEIELNVTTQYRKEIEEREAQLAKETQVY